MRQKQLVTTVRTAYVVLHGGTHPGYYVSSPGRTLHDLPHLPDGAIESAADIETGFVDVPVPAAAAARTVRRSR